MIIQNKILQSALSVALVTVFLLLVPLAGKLISNEVEWSPGDFVIAGILLFSTGFTYKLVTMLEKNVIYRVATGLALASGLFLIWSNVAVGIIGSEDNPANAMYLAVIAIGVIGVVASKFQANKMAYAAFAMATTQLIITVIALILGLHHDPWSSLAEILSVNGFFITLFIVSGMLFRWAADEMSNT